MEYLSQILSFLVGLAAGWTIRIYVSNRSGNSNQSGNKVGGDMAGRDIRK